MRTTFAFTLEAELFLELQVKLLTLFLLTRMNIKTNNDTIDEIKTKETRDIGIREEGGEDANICPFKY